MQVMLRLNDAAAAEMIALPSVQVKETPISKDLLLTEQILS
jgi:hypothetical protein